VISREIALPLVLFGFIGGGFFQTSAHLSPFCFILASATPAASVISSSAVQESLRWHLRVLISEKVHD